MYRLNCNLADDLAARLGEHSERTGISRVTIVSMALDQYLMQEEVKRQLMEKMSDPAKLAEVAKALGMPLPSAKE